MSFKNVLRLIRHYKSIYVNFKLFDFKTAIHMPILISNRVKCIGLTKGVVTLTEPPEFGMITMGIKEGSSGIWHYDPCHGILDFSNGTVELGKNISIPKGFSIKCIKGGHLKIGNNFIGNAYITMFASEEITIGNDCTVGYNVFMNNGDGHKILNAETNEVTNSRKPVHIADHVWVCANVNLLKGSSVNRDSIVGFGATVGKEFTETNCCIVGPYPGKVVKTGVNWKH